ncbi:DUF1995 domain-containing protein [Pseudoscourfieldia marina]
MSAHATTPCRSRAFHSVHCSSKGFGAAPSSSSSSSQPKGKSSSRGKKKSGRSKESKSLVDAENIGTPPTSFALARSSARRLLATDCTSKQNLRSSVELPLRDSSPKAVADVVARILLPDEDNQKCILTRGVDALVLFRTNEAAQRFLDDVPSSLANDVNALAFSDAAGEGSAADDLSPPAVLVMAGWTPSQFLEDKDEALALLEEASGARREEGRSLTNLVVILDGSPVNDEEKKALDETMSPVYSYFPVEAALPFPLMGQTVRAAILCESGTWATFAESPNEGKTWTRTSTSNTRPNDTDVELVLMNAAAARSAVTNAAKKGKGVFDNLFGGGKKP